MKTVITKEVIIGFVWGIVGGLFLILLTMLTSKGILQISPYPVILIAAIITVKYIEVTSNIFKKLFITGFLTFVIMSIILYIYIVTFINPDSGIDFVGHLWRFGIIIGLGIISSALLSIIAKPIR